MPISYILFIEINTGMKINTATSMITESIFPKHTFSGNIELTEDHINLLLREISATTLYKYNWGMSGWNEDPDEVWNLTPKIQSVSTLLLKQCFDAVTNLQNYPTLGNIMHVGNSQFYLEVRRCFPIIISPGHDYPYCSHPGAYTGITMLKCTDQGHKVYMRNLNHTYFEQNMKFWMPEVKQQIFLPATEAWGVSSGTDKSQTVALVSHIIVKRAA